MPGIQLRIPGVEKVTTLAIGTLDYLRNQENGRRSRRPCAQKFPKLKTLLVSGYDLSLRLKLVAVPPLDQVRSVRRLPGQGQAEP